MGCGCNSGGGSSAPAQSGGWSQIPELRLLQTPVATGPSAPPQAQPDRATPPPPVRPGLPWWVWVVLTVLALEWARRR